MLRIATKPTICLAVLLRFFAPIPPTYAAPQQVPLQGPNHVLRHGAIACESRVCSTVGIDLLAAGGNAADALVGTAFCVGVVDSHHSGIGGGGFALARSSSGEYESIDFREAAPAAAYEEMFEDNVLGSLAGGLASGVPGDARGLEYIHTKHGVLPWSSVLAPAIKLATGGFVVSEDFASAMDFSEQRYGVEFLSQDPVWAEDFAPSGKRVQAGDIMSRRRYGRTLQAMADHGAQILYEGSIANATIDTIARNNGTMTLQDLADYTVISRAPVEIDYNGYAIRSCGAPASGAVTLSALKTLEAFDDGQDNENLHVHRMTEAMRFAFGKRASLGDPDHVRGLLAYEQEMISTEYAQTTRSKISDDHTLNVSEYDPHGFEILQDHGTSHIVSIDEHGMAFSLTTTVNLFFGSRVMVPETGVILNNEMNDFSIPNTRNAFGYYPSPANYPRPFARPLSSISPIIIEHSDNKNLHSIHGASGGSFIITTTLSNTLHLLDDNMTMTEALRSPRVHDQLLPNVTQLEKSNVWKPDLDAFMKSRGHEVVWADKAGSSGQGVRVTNDGKTFEAAAEPRQHDSAGLVI